MIHACLKRSVKHAIRQAQAQNHVGARFGPDKKLLPDRYLCGFTKELSEELPK